MVDNIITRKNRPFKARMSTVIKRATKNTFFCSLIYLFSNYLLDVQLVGLKNGRVSMLSNARDGNGRDVE